jgi:hypothetical protein
MTSASTVAEIEAARVAPAEKAIAYFDGYWIDPRHWDRYRRARELKAPGSIDKLYAAIRYCVVHHLMTVTRRA